MKENKNISEEKNNSSENNSAVQHNTENTETDKTLQDKNKETLQEGKDKEEDNRSFSEKLEDGMDELVGGIQDVIYGERRGMSEDIPATMRDPDTEIRKINKVQTRRNIRKRIFGDKGRYIFLVIIAIMMAIGLIVSFLK